MTEPSFPVLVWAGDGPVILEHTAEELERLWHGVDRDVVQLLGREPWGHDGEEKE